MNEIFNPNEWQMMGRVFFSMLLGAIIGFDREIAHKPAGLRTHILVAASATIFASLGISLVDLYKDALGDAIRSDPIRIVQATIIGISFIGAGTIIKDKDSANVQGLTTAASLLLAAALGLGAALDKYAYCLTIAIVVFLILRILGYFEFRFFDKK